MACRLLLLVSIALSAGAGTIQYALPPHLMVNDVAFSADGRLFIAASRGLIALDRSGRATVVAADVSLLGLVVTNDGAVWGHEHDLLVRIDPATDQISRFQIADSVGSFGAGEDGALWVITRGNGNAVRSLVRFDGDGRVLSTAPVAGSASLRLARLVAVAGVVWGVLDNQLVTLDAGGVTASFPLPLPNALWFVSGGDFLWLANDPLNAGDHSEILRIGPGGEVLARYPLPVRYIIGAAADQAGNLWLSDEFSGGIVRLTPSGDATAITAAVWNYSPLDVQPMAVAPDGRIAIGKSDPGFWPTPAHGVVFLIDPAQPHEIPVLSPAAVLIFVVAIAAAGAVATVGRL